MPGIDAAVVNLDAAILTDLRCGECGGQLNMTPVADVGWLISCPRGSCERFGIRYHALLLPLIKYEEPPND